MVRQSRTQDEASLKFWQDRLAKADGRLAHRVSMAETRQSYERQKIEALNAIQMYVTLLVSAEYINN